MSTEPTAIKKEFHNYLKKYKTVDDALRNDLKAYAIKHKIPEIWISEEQVQIMQWLLKAFNTKNVLEIGTLVGYSAMMMAKVLPDDGRILTMEIDKRFAKIAQTFWNRAGLQKKIEVVIGDALINLPAILENNIPFDFVFIDADKINYKKYYELIINHSNGNTIIAFDNAFAFGQIQETNTTDEDVLAIQDLTNFIKNDHRVNSTILPVGDGLLLVVKK